MTDQKWEKNKIKNSREAAQSFFILIFAF